MQESLCNGFFDDSYKESIRFLDIVSLDYKLIYKLRKYSFYSFLGFGKWNKYGLSILLIFMVGIFLLDVFRFEESKLTPLNPHKAWNLYP